MIKMQSKQRVMTVIGIAATTVMGAAYQVDGNDRESAYESAWNRVVFYDEPNSNTLKKFAFTGRLQGDYYNFDGSDWGSDSDFNWRRFRVGFKASLFDGLTLHSEADMNLNDPAPLYKKLTDSNLAWASPGGTTIKVGRQSAPFTLDGATSSKKTLYS